MATRLTLLLGTPCSNLQEHLAAPHVYPKPWTTDLESTISQPRSVHNSHPDMGVLHSEVLTACLKRDLSWVGSMSHVSHLTGLMRFISALKESRGVCGLSCTPHLPASPGSPSLLLCPSSGPSAQQHCPHLGAGKKC